MAEEQTQTPAVQPPAEAKTEKKNKKINRLTPDELNSQIADYESKGQTKSRFYRHLVARRDEMQKRG